MKADFHVGIVGAGFAGLIAALRLKKSGRASFVIFERAAALGGTWRDNVYPGCGCDIASPLYSIAGEPNPHWSKLYAAQPEILNYMHDVANRNDLLRHIRFRTDVVEARFLEDKAYWQVADRKGNTTTVTLLLLALGPLNRPYLPSFPGLDEFRGKKFHSAAWDTSYNLQGKRVAVIGTGASSIQIVPAIARQVAQLTVVQRTPAWIVPQLNMDFGTKSKWLFRHFPRLQLLLRNGIYWVNELIGYGFIGNKVLNRMLAWLSLRKLRNEVKNTEVRKKLKPHYTIGCKRILRSDDFYPTFNLPHVQLVTNSIERFTPRGFITSDGTEHHLDAVIFGTGFVAADIEIYTRVTGKGGRSLVEEWQQKGAEAYLGTTVSGFPNLALLLGPNTGLGHNSVLLMMEFQMNYIMQYLACLEKSGEGSYLDVRAAVQEAYNRKLQQQFKGTVWASGCQSWYSNKEGKNTTLYPRLTVSFNRKTRKFDPALYQLGQQHQHSELVPPAPDVR